MQKLILLSVIFTTTFGDGLLPFVSDKTREKMYTQFLGLVKFVFRMEEEKPIRQDVTFNLYTRSNPEEADELFVDDSSSLRFSHFNSESKIIFVIHGYTDHKDRDIIINLRRVLVTKLPANVIVVDWRRLAGLIYFNAASYALTVGKYLAKFLRFLETQDIPLSNVHLVGHSLGAQISGVAGGILKGQVGRITGLDPAGPLFEFIYTRNVSESLDITDALFVDIIHTAGDDFGIMLPVGHADFYPNDGTTPQPGCTNILTAISCSHVKAVEFFTESVNGTIPFIAKRCRSFLDKTLKNCSSRDVVPMGYFTPPKARGNYYLQTNPDSPYAMGGKFYRRSVRSSRMHSLSNIRH